MKFTLATGLLVACLTHAFGGIETNSPALKVNTSATNTPSPTSSEAAARQGSYAADDKYKLRIGDRVSFQVIEDRDTSKSLVIADSGELDVPYLGRVMAVDKTCKQLA